MKKYLADRFICRARLRRGDLCGVRPCEPQMRGNAQYSPGNEVHGQIWQHGRGQEGDGLNEGMWVASFFASSSRERAGHRSQPFLFQIGTPAITRVVPAEMDTDAGKR